MARSVISNGWARWIVVLNSHALNYQMAMKNLLAVCLCGLLLAAAPAAAQSPREAAIGALRNYLSVMAIAKLCGFELEKPMVAAIVANINALQPASGLSDKDLDGMLLNSVQSYGRTKAAFCAPGLDSFYGLVPDYLKAARDEAAASGVTLLAVPERVVAAPPPPPATVAPAPAAAPQPPEPLPQPAVDKDKEAAVAMLNQAIMVEAVAYQCKITLSGPESLMVDRAQYYWRGRANYTPAQFKVVQEFWETDTAKSEEKYCAAAFGFRARLEAALNSIK